MSSQKRAVVESDIDRNTDGSLKRESKGLRAEIAKGLPFDQSVDLHVHGRDTEYWSTSFGECLFFNGILSVLIAQWLQMWMKIRSIRV